MNNFKVGIFINNLHLSFDESLEKCREIGAAGFQLDYDKYHPETTEQIAEKRAKIASHGLVVSAMCTGVRIEEDDAQNAETVAEVTAVADYANAIGTHVITGHIGVVPEKKATAYYARMLSVMTAIGEVCAERGCTFAIETGPENTCILGEFISQIPRGVGVNFDPANVVMAQFSANGADAVAPVAKYIVHTHAKDGINIDGRGKEVPLGQGWVDFPLYLSTLRNAGFTGFLTIERECGNDPVADISAAINFLRSLEGVE